MAWSDVFPHKDPDKAETISNPSPLPYIHTDFLPLLLFLFQVRVAPAWWASRCRATASSATPSTPPPGWSPTGCVSIVARTAPNFGMRSHVHFSVVAEKIHVSPSTREVLEKFNCFELEYRGEMEMKVSCGACCRCTLSSIRLR